MRALALAAGIWFLAAGMALAAPAPASAIIRAGAGRPMHVPEPTYRWHGLTVPVGVCGAVVSGRVMVLPCGDARVVAYRRQRAAAKRRAADGWWAGLGGAVLLAGVGIGAGTGLARWRRVAGAAGTTGREGGGR